MTSVRFISSQFGGLRRIVARKGDGVDGPPARSGCPAAAPAEGEVVRPVAHPVDRCAEEWVNGDADQALGKASRLKRQRVKRPPPVGKQRSFWEGRRLKVVALLSVPTIAAVVAAAVVAGTGGGSHQARLIPPSNLPGELTDPAPWRANIGQLRARLAASGLPSLGAEGTRLHIHQHVDIYVKGRRVTVPAGIGIGIQGLQLFFSPIHTHDATGVVHVESPVVKTFSLGQFFAVWGVRFTPNCLGGYCATAADKLRVYSDGKLVTGDPRALPLQSHEEIVVAYGTKAELPKPIPSSYRFPAGL
jgi:hypothetical protein